MMNSASQRGILLLPVALTLAVIGTLAYTMAYDGSMNVAAVDAQYEIERARYLAASGVQLARWRAAKNGCDEDDARFGTIRFLDSSGTALGKVTVDATNTKLDNGILTLSLTATTARDAVRALTRKEQVMNLTEVKNATIIGGGDDDTTIVKGGSAGQNGADTLTATQDNAHPLVMFKMPGDLDKGAVIQATLEVTKNNGNAKQPGRSLAVHRITREWKAKEATWEKAGPGLWTQEGGDYVPTASASVVIDPGSGAFNGAYTWRVDALADSWANRSVPNYGVLLKPTALANVAFVSFNGGNKPKLIVRYYKRCT
jgi:hypothetical protein